jgi:glycosyltransferase involved in cell wall biosynthesis
VNVLIAHTSPNPYLRHASLALREREMLDHLCIGYLDHPDYWLSRFLKAISRRVRPSFVHELERRRFADLPFEKIRTYPFWELLRTFVSRYVDAPRLADRLWEIQDHRFDRWVAGQVTPSLDAVHTFEHAALSTLQAAARVGVTSFYEQPSQHHSFFRRIYREQIDAYPELEDAHADLHDSPLSRKRNQRRDEELATADVVLCNSSFTKRTLTGAGVHADKILATPYGFPEPDPKPPSVPERVTFLNAGTQSLRKGIHLLYDAWRCLAPGSSEAALQLIGRMTLPEDMRDDLPGTVQISDSIPHRKLMKRYKEASVFVLPSLADGFGMVVTEAMSRGLPVITTDNTGAADVITHGENGFVVPAGDVDALVEQMRWCIDNKDQLPEVGRQAVETTCDWQWADYRAALGRKISNKIQESHHVFS